MEQRGSTLDLSLDVADRRHSSIAKTLTGQKSDCGLGGMCLFSLRTYCREKGEMHWAERVESGLRTEIGTSECVNARLNIGSVILNRNGSYMVANLLCFSAPWKSGLDSEHQQRSKTLTGHGWFSSFIFFLAARGDNKSY